MDTAIIILLGVLRSFRSRYSTELSPAVITSNWAYFTVATGTAYTVPADAEVTFDGTTWLAVNGTTPAGAKRWKMRFEASPDHDTSTTKTAVLDGVDWPFTVRTHVEDDIEDVLFGGDTDVTLGGEDVIW